MALYACACFSQEAGLLKKLESAPQDTKRVGMLIDLAYEYTNHNFRSSIGYAGQALELSEKLDYLKGRVDAYNCMADAYWYHSDYEKAQLYYFKSYRINDSIHNKAGIAFALYNIGWIVCIQQHNYKEDHYLVDAYRIYSQLNNRGGLMRCCNALGSYYSDKYYSSKQRPYFDSALKYFEQGISLAKSAGQYERVVNFYSNMADLYANMNDFNSALFYNDKAFVASSHISDTTTIVMTSINKANYMVHLKRYNEALPRLLEALDYSRSHDIRDVELNTIDVLIDCYAGMGRYDDAYTYFNRYTEIKDSINKQTYSTNMQEMKSSYELDKAETNLKEQRHLNDIQELKNKQNGYFIFILIGVALAVIVVAVLLFRQNKQKQSANILLKEQNNVIAEKKHEIENSIQYAKGIQNALLPDLPDLAAAFPESFVFYQPKDVVSGDFYWFQQIDDCFYCIAADCTGHGVPGALMSIIGIDKIVQAIFEKKLESPGEILSFLNNEIKSVLKQHNDEAKQKDGMDIALLRFGPGRHMVEYAAANRPLYIVREGQIIEYKADKVAIAGFTPANQVYATATVELQKHDSLFIFSDGYADQFGGDSGKKFMTKNLKQLFLEIAGLSANEQFAKVRETFQHWKKEYEQVDDVLVIGINIT